MTENEIAGAVIDAAYEVHSTLGPGLLESVYEKALAQELALREVSARAQVSVPVKYKGAEFPEGFRADLIVGEKVIVELKAMEKLSEIHSTQLLTYLRLSWLRLGLLINFGALRLRSGIKRVVNGLED